MDINVEKECSALGNLFQQIVTDMKNGTPLWEDLISKATKLHTCLRAAILAVSAYLEAFQKIADAATNARGATKEIGTALTRICLRHKAVETRMKSFTCAIMDCLVTPLQEKLEDWKKSLVNLDKEHSKEYKKAKAELKKRSSDTFRLQKKKARKGQMIQGHGTTTVAIGYPNTVHSQQQSHIQRMTATNTTNTTTATDQELDRLLESSAAVVHEKRLSLEETERRAVRAALLEERGRYCLLARFLKPVLDEEIAMLMELTHLQEVSVQLERHAASPLDLPAASEQMITDLKSRDSGGQWALATPPSSPSLSLGSRKSSMCSISSLTSSSSGSCKNHPSPCAHPWHRSLSQPPLLRPASIGPIVSMSLRHSTSSRDSGFTSQDTLYKRAIFEHQVSNASSQSNQSAGCTTVSSRALTTATWPDLQESTQAQYDRQSPNTVNERPHTISSAYEKGHQRAALSVYTFQPPERGDNCCHSQPASPVSSPSSNQQLARVQLRKNSAASTIGGTRPPIPSRCSSLERPTSNSGGAAANKNETSSSTRGKPKLPIPAHLAKELGASGYPLAQPMYVNMHELASLAANRAQEMQQLPHVAQQVSVAGTPVVAGVPIVTGASLSTPDKVEAITEKDGGGSQTSESSLESSSGYGSQTTLQNSQSVNNQHQYQNRDDGNNSTNVGWNNGAPSTCKLSRRGSMQRTTRPPPPTRRTSTIISGNCGVSLIPPGSTIANVNATTGYVRAIDISAEDNIGPNATPIHGSNLDETENLPPPPAFLLEGSSPTVSPTPQRSISVSETVRTLTELRHTPASPSFLRKATSATPPPQQQQQQQQQQSRESQSSNLVPARSNLKNMETTNSPSGNSLTQATAPGGVGHSFMAVLSSKLMASSSSSVSVVPTGSPKSIRKHTTRDTTISNRNNHRASSSFLESLGAKLGAHQQQHQLPGQTSQTASPTSVETGVATTRSANNVGRSASVRRIMGNRVPIIDPAQVRDSLMDQIRRGTSLRKTSGPINDRSAPQIF